MKDRFYRILGYSVIAHAIMFLLFLRILIPIDGRLLLCLPLSSSPVGSAAGLSEWPTDLEAFMNDALSAQGDLHNAYDSPEIPGFEPYDADRQFLPESANGSQRVSPDLPNAALQSGVSNLLSELILQNSANFPGSLSGSQTRQLIDKMLEQLAGHPGATNDEVDRLPDNAAFQSELAEKIYQQLKTQLRRRLQEQAIASAGDMDAGEKSAGSAEFSAKSGSHQGGGSGEHGNSDQGADGESDVELSGSENGKIAGSGTVPTNGAEGRMEGAESSGTGGLASLLQSLQEQDLSNLQKLAALLDKSDYQRAAAEISAAVTGSSAAADDRGALVPELADILESTMSANPGSESRSNDEITEDDLAQLAERLLKASSGGSNNRQDQTGSSGSSSPRRGGRAADGNNLVYQLDRFLMNALKDNRTREEVAVQRYTAPLAGWQQQRVPAPERIYLSTRRQLRQAPLPSRLQPPAREVHAYGAAVRPRTPIIVDGDLREWESARSYRLQGEIQGREGQLPPEFRASNAFQVMWDASGLYVAYWLKDNHDKMATVDNFWNGDALELFIDPANAKRIDRLDGKSLQYWFWPRHKYHPAAFGQMRFYPDGARSATVLSVDDIAIASRRRNAGYTCEVFLPRRFLADMQLIPGNVIGFNYSMNNGSGMYLRWVTNKGDNSAFRPNLWGDLLLMGSDAVIKPAKAWLLPGESLELEVDDPDQNIDAVTREQVTVGLINSITGYRISRNLIETSPNSGRFHGSIATDLPGSGRAGVIAVNPGEQLVIEYIDQFASGGKKDVRRSVKVPLGRGTMRFAGSAKVDTSRGL